ncbi:putative S-adenosyl-L-methionine-dependent methyltransferase, Methyltransferase domain 25 [Septoria linicola]|nr:putative S-adenosyl-L-methionine-dependent methyltransferase, Methyltransferase domain 25 [Septoria linicola]
MSSTTEPKDHWSSQAYNSAAGFVPKLTSTVFSYLDPQKTDNILDIGCGDGECTAKIAQATTEGQVLGVDASISFIDTANERYIGDGFGNMTFILHDATKLETCREIGSEVWDKVFSNAAMHWILRQPEIRKGFFENVFKALKPGGTFVFEMGGAGNVAEVQVAAISALVHQGGVSLERAREASPWCFPSVDGMTKLLTAAGFEVEKCETEYRPSQTSPKQADGSGGLEGWVKLMCAQFIEVAPEDKQAAVVKEILDLLETVITREDGTQWLGYVRLRAIARKSNDVD